MSCMLFIYPCTGNIRKGLKGRHIWNLYCTFSSSFSVTVMTLFKDASVIAYACAFTNPFNHSFRPYIKACIVSLVARLGNALWCCWIRWCTPVWFHTIAALIVYLGQHSCGLMAHIGLWTCAQSQEMFWPLLFILLSNPSSMLHCLQSKQCCIDMLAWCCFPYKEYGQL